MSNINDAGIITNKQTITEWASSLDPSTFSFIIPTTFSNLRRHYLDLNLKTIASFKKTASDFNYEIIIVLDGGDYQKTYDFKKYLHDLPYGLHTTYICLKNKSGTVTIPRNIGISWATGKIIIPTDDDCLIEDKKIELMTYLFSQLGNNKKFAYGNRYEYTLTGDGDHLFTRQFNSKYFVDRGQPGLDNGQFVYSADIYEKVKPVFSINACDWELYKEVQKHYELTHLDEFVCSYIWHTENISRIPKNQRVNPLNILQSYLMYFKNNGFKNECESLLIN